MAVARALVVVCQRGGTSRGQGDHTRGRINRVPAIVITRADREGHVIAVHVTGLDLAQLDARSGVLVVANRIAGRRRVARAIGARRGEDRTRFVRTRRRATFVRIFKRRRIILRDHGDDDFTGGGATLTVINDHGEFVRTVVVRVRDVAVLASLRIDGDRTIARRLADNVSQLISVSVGTCDLTVDSGVFRGRDLVITRVRVKTLARDVTRFTRLQAFVRIYWHRQIVDRGNVNADCAGAAAAIAVGHCDHKRILPVVTGLRGVGVRARLWIDRHSAIGRLPGNCVGQRITVPIGTSNTPAHRVVLCDGMSVVRGLRRSVAVLVTIAIVD